MNKKNQIITIDNIQNRILTVRGRQVMLDSDLAELYDVSTGRLNEQVKRNIERFPQDFMFQLTKKEWNEIYLRSQNATLNTGRGRHRKYLPFVFTEQGVSSLSGVLKSEIAVKVNIAIMRAFVGMRKFLMENATVFQRLDKIELKQLETDKKVGSIIKALEDKSIKPNQGIFFNGQVFDAYTFVSDLIRSAKKSIILIDNYIDDTILMHLTKRKKGVSFTVFTKNISKQLKLDIKKHNDQYEQVTIKTFKDAHDRFLIIDEKEVYHFGASLKDLGKKWFAFSKMDISSVKVLDKLKEEGLI
jgi:hypothetical protein